MAYGLNFLSRVEQTHNLDKTLNVKDGMDTFVKPQLWVYNASSSGANNSVAQTVAADYFASAYGYVTTGDLVYVYANDGVQILTVTASTSSTVTTSKISS